MRILFVNRLKYKTSIIYVYRSVLGYIKGFHRIKNVNICQLSQILFCFLILRIAIIKTTISFVTF